MPLAGKLSRDPDDNLFVATAAAAQASFLVTEDRDFVTAIGWAESHWTAASPDPIVLVGAYNVLTSRASFSNVGSDVDAPGVGVLSTVADGG